MKQQSRSGLVEGKVALVTGAGSGIGRASAILFAREGAAGVLVVDTNRDGADETVEAISTEGGAASALVADITQRGDVDAMIAEVTRRWGRLDCAHNNVGIAGPARPMGEYADDEFEQVMHTNVYGTFACMRAELAYMVPRGSGTIVNTSSAVTVLAVPGHAAYTASKAAVNGLTTAAAREYAGTGIRINAVMPGGVNTERGRAASRRQYGDLGAAERDYPLGRLGDPFEVAEAVVWLSSDRSSYVIGERLLVDGGFYSAHQRRPKDGSIKQPAPGPADGAAASG